MATVAIQYSSSTTIQCTLTDLVSSSTLARSSNSVDNSVNLYDDSILHIEVRTTGTATAADKACFVYIYGATNGTNWSASKGESVGLDGIINLQNPTNLLGPVAIATPGTSQIYGADIPIAPFFGGRMPKVWGFAIRNGTKNTLHWDDGSMSKNYIGIKYTVV